MRLLLLIYDTFQNCNEEITLFKTKKTALKCTVSFLNGDLAGARTQDPLLKREMLYQLSYQVF